MRIRRAACNAILLGATSACLGPVSHPVTAPVPAGREIRVSGVRDTLRLLWSGAPTVAPVAGETCAARRVTGLVERHSGDTIRFSRVSWAEPARATRDPACDRHGGAMLIAPAVSVQVEELVPVSLPVQVGGSAALITAVLLVSLLVFNAADGILNAVGRWF